MNKILVIIIISIVLLASCAGPNPNLNQVREESEAPAGFFMGTWHGIIAPLAFIGSLFDPNIHIYEVYNNGIGYNLGYVAGAYIIIFALRILLKLFSKGN